jgi:2-amino-4-hydroxy-6-hydroxymethyldihydropteridine diphosphokinase
LALGAREGHRLRQMQAAVAALADAGLEVLTLSSLWETEPVDLPPGPSVFNAVLECRGSLAPDEILAHCHRLEAEAGRIRAVPERRSLDLDILLMGPLVLKTRSLELPHPRFHTRRFNLAPLAEISPGAIHPLLKKTSESLLAACTDRAWVRIVEKDWLDVDIERVSALG